MKIMVVGVGHLGSQVAWHVLRELKPKILVLKDIKNLEGDLMDLTHASRGMNIKTVIREDNEYEPMDYIIITAGFPRTKTVRTHEELYSKNKSVMGNIVTQLKSTSKIGPKTTIIVMTNPVEQMTQLVKDWLPANVVMNPEAELMRIRLGKEVGWKIVSTKGYTNFGPAVSVVKLLERLI